MKTIAIAGATGAVGQLVIRLLEERNFPAENYKFLASKRSVGKSIEFRGQSHAVELLESSAFDEVDVVIGSTPDDVALEFAPWAVERGAVVIDESGAHRMMKHVPLVVPECNPDAALQHQGIIASPNCSTTQMVVCLQPLHDFARVRRVIVSTYQATSGAGVAGQNDLIEGSQAALYGTKRDSAAFQHPIAFNVIPQIGSHKEAGYTSEEMKMVYETRKILGDEEIQVCPTCVRVPVSNCHSESIIVETEKPVSVEKANELFAAESSIKLLDDLSACEYPMPSNCDDQDEVFVGRVRKDLSAKNSLAFWCVSDNLRKGAATNAVQIAELLVKAAASAK